MPPTDSSSSADLAPDASFAAGVWRVADPKITLASVASMIVGGAAAAHDGPIAWGWLAATVLGIFAIEAAKNASGEIFDWDSGADQGVSDEERSPFSGGKRVIVDGLLGRRETAWDENEDERIRAATRAGRPVAESDDCELLERLLGPSVTARPKGRPPTRNG